MWYNNGVKARNDMSKSMIDKIDYTVYCVNEFARSNSLSDFYVENSQQPMSLMLQDMAECCRSRGGTLV